MPTSSRLRCVRVFAAILFPVLAASCGGDVTGGASGNGGAIASVVVTGAPAAPMLVGDSVRLVASAVNATGGLVSNQLTSWSSSAPSVAAVASDGRVQALGAGTTTITASVGGKSGTAAIEVTFGVTLGTQGGTLSASNGKFRLTLPAGTLSQSTLLVVRPSTSGPADGRVVANTVFELGPDGMQFQRAATLTVAYDAAALPATLAAESLQLYQLSGAVWTSVGGSTVDLSAHTATGSIYRAGVYAVRSTPVDHIVLTGAAAGGALYAGQSSQISAALLGAAGDSLPARAITWSSSAPTVVGVDGSGKLTALSAGTATITAATDGKSVNATVTVLTRATADWSRATDWTTYQGNPQHSGYTDAMLDPGTFVQRWVANPGPGAFYQPTAAGGRVFLATNSYFGAQKVIALDPANGSQLWQRDFGGIFGINQVTYDGGVVYLTSGGHEDTYLWALKDVDGTLRYQTAFNSQWEHWKAPVVSGSTIVTAGGYYGGMYGFDRATGKQLFFNAGSQVDGWGPAASGALVYTTDGGVKGTSPLDGHVVVQLSDSRLQAVTTPVVGSSNNLMAITGNRLVSVDLGTNKVAWEQSGSYTGMPVAGRGVVYGSSGTVVAARAESDGALRWTWSPAGNTVAVTSLLLTGNILFVGATGGAAGVGTTYAIDLNSHLAVWSYPMAGDMALSAQGVLYVVQGGKVAAISVR